MRRLLLGTVIALLALAAFPATADAKCPTCVDGVSVQTPDGQPWTTGKPVTLVVSARRGAPGSEFPTSGIAVVMRTDGDRTKCLDVPLKLVQSDGDSAIYAGVFYPFRSAAYDGKLSLGDNTFDISFDVRKIAATTPIASAPGLPTGSTEEADAFTFSGVAGPIPLIGFAIVVWSAIAVYLSRRQPRRLGLTS